MISKEYAWQSEANIEPLSAESLRLNDGYDLAIGSADIDGNKAYVELLKDSQVVDSKIIIAANEVDDTFIYSKPGTSLAIKAHFKNAFRGADQNLVTVDNIWQTSEFNSSHILINNTKSLIFSPETPLKLEDGYELVIKSVDIDGNKTYVELLKDERIIDSKVIIAANKVDDTLVYSKPGTSQAIKVHFKNVFRGADQNLAMVDSIWQTSEIDPFRTLINDSQSRIVTSGTPLIFDEGYELAIRSIDIDGNKVHLDLSKDGQVVDSKVIIAANEVDDTFIHSKPGTQQGIMVHFKNAFRGADRNLVTIDGVLQISGTVLPRVLVD